MAPNTTGIRLSHLALTFVSAAVLTVGAAPAPPASAGELCSAPPLSLTGPTPNVLAAPVRYVEIPGARLGYRIAGRGTPLVLIPGSSNTMAEWDPPFLNRLARQHRLIIFDNRGTGTSTGSVSNLTVGLMARDTANFIARVAGPQANVLGWSMGGYVAQRLALDYPGRVRRLILVSTNPGSPAATPPTPAALKILTDPNATQAQRMSILFPKNQQAAGAKWSAAVGAAFAANHYQPGNSFTIPPATATAQINAAGPLWLGPGRGVLNQLQRIQQPVLVAAGRNDVVVPIANVRLFNGRVPHLTTVVYPDSGHAFLFQFPLRFADEVNLFIGRC